MNCVLHWYLVGSIVYVRVRVCLCVRAEADLTYRMFSRVAQCTFRFHMQQTNWNITNGNRLLSLFCNMIRSHIVRIHNAYICYLLRLCLCRMLFLHILFRPYGYLESNADKLVGFFFLWIHSAFHVCKEMTRTRISMANLWTFMKSSGIYITEQHDVHEHGHCLAKALLYRTCYFDK